MPHLKTLVERHKDDPFALIGINYRDDAPTFRKGVKDFGVTWISAYQGMEMSPISALYRVSVYPTYVILDTDGKIAYRGSSRDAIDPVVKKLIAKAKQ